MIKISLGTLMTLCRFDAAEIREALEATAAIVREIGEIIATGSEECLSKSDWKEDEVVGVDKLSEDEDDEDDVLSDCRTELMRRIASSRRSRVPNSNLRSR